MESLFPNLVYIYLKRMCQAGKLTLEDLNKMRQDGNLTAEEDRMLREFEEQLSDKNKPLPMRCDEPVLSDASYATYKKLSMGA